MHIIYDLYNTIVMTVEMTSDKFDRVSLRVYSVMISGAIWLSLFVLMAIGLCTMARKRGMKGKWMAFVPFANVLLIGRLAGECDVFGRKMKRAGTYAMIFELIASVLSLSILFAELYLFIKFGSPLTGEESIDVTSSSYDWPGNCGMEKFYHVTGYFVGIVSLVCSIFMIILLMGLFKKYATKNYFLFSILSLFVPGIQYVFIFACRNNKPVDFAAYMRARREAYMRQQQQYYNQHGNPYNRGPYGQNPYGQNQNPYGGAQGQSSPKEEDPFSEFSDDKKSGSANGNPSNGGSAGSGDSDGFFD